MKDVATGPPTIQLFNGLSEVVQNWLVDELEFAFQCRGNYLSGEAFKNQAKPLLTLSQAFLGELAFFNIEIHSNPIQQSPIARTKRFGPAKEPAVPSFRVANSETHLAGGARTEACRPDPACLFVVVWMQKRDVGIPLCVRRDTKPQGMFFR
jgi:hypothetical protein